MAIIPIPAGRTSEMLVRQRLLLQLGDNQSGLLRLETQISSGQRLILPSDDAPAALRALGLKQLLNRKDQAAINLQTSQSFLAASDAALSQVSNLLLDTRGTAQSVLGTVATDEQRAAAAEQVHAALEQLVNTANQQFRGRYLFAGSRSDVKPFELIGDSVEYHGNPNSLFSFADIGQLFQTNADGDSVFGAVSTAVRGTADLNPVLTDDTRLADLHGGLGMEPGKISISDGTTTRVVDLAGAETIGNVIDLLQRNAPPGRELLVSLTSQGLNVQLDAVGGGNLTIQEVGAGRTATDLGILRQSGSGVGPIIGQDLNPRLVDTTPLDNLLGTRASVTLSAPGTENDIVIEARAAGSATNGVAVTFVNDITLTPGQETVAYDATAKTLIFQVNAGHSTAADVVSALNNDPAAGAVFSARLNSHDLGQADDPNSTLANASAVGLMTGGSGTPLDRQSGLQLTSGQETFTIDISQAQTMQDLLNQINGSDAGLLAEINATGNGIDLRSRRSGVDFSIGENGGNTASHLGIRSLTAETRLENLNHGAGVHTLESNQPDLIIQRKDGIELKYDLSAAKTIGDVLDLINNDPANQNPTYSVTARLATFGNGIELVTTSTHTNAPLAVLRKTTSTAAIDLGLIPPGANQSLPAVANGGTETLTGRDVNPLEVDGMFTALVRLERALRVNNDTEITRAMGVLNDNMDRLNLARAELGARQQGLDTLKTGLQAEVTMLKESLSQEIDTDFPSAISELAGRQAAFEAALQTAAAISRLSLLDFL